MSLLHFSLVLRVLRKNLPEARIVVTALFYRKDVVLIYVDKSNGRCAKRWSNSRTQNV